MAHRAEYEQKVIMVPVKPGHNGCVVRFLKLMMWIVIIAIVLIMLAHVL